MHVHSASRRLVGLRNDANDFVFARERVERRDGKLRSAEKENAQSGAMLSRRRVRRGRLILQLRRRRGNRIHRLRSAPLHAAVRLRRRALHALRGGRLRRFRRRMRHRRRLILKIARCFFATARSDDKSSSKHKSAHEYG